MTEDAARQRWRLVLRVPAASLPGERPSGVGAWSDSLVMAGLPLAIAGGRGPRVSAAAPLPLGIRGEREIVDVYLAERLPIADVRARLEAGLPAGVTLLDLHDVWLGGPAAPAAVRAADYRIEAAGAAGAVIGAAVARLLAAASLPRERPREKRTVRYDLRPLIEQLEVRAWQDATPGGPAGVLGMRLRHGPEATGRPEEVLAALADEAGTPLDARTIVRERLVLDEGRRKGAAG